jgi:hypothetical protein
MKKIVIFNMLFLSLFIQCGDANEDVMPKSGDAITADPVAITSESIVEGKVLTLKELLHCIDSSAVSNGGALSCLLANKEFLASRNSIDIELIYYTYWEAMNDYLDKNIPYIDEKNLDKNYQLDSKYEQSLNNRGFYVEADGEGGYFPMVDRSILYEVFKGVGDDALEAYLTFFSTQRDFIAFDAGLALNPIEIAKRVVFFDTQFEKYPAFVFRDEMRMFYEREMYFVMFGLDNTPAFEFGTNILIDEHKKALEYLMKNATKFTQDVVKKYYKSLEQNGWHMLEDGYDKYYFGIGKARK